MKIVAGNYFGKNIQFVCRCCNCVYEVESKDDWNIRMVFPNYCSFKYKVPEYEVACPNCGHGKYLGFINVYQDDIEKMEHLGYQHYIFEDDFGGEKRKDTFIPKSYGHIYDGYIDSFQG